MSDVACHCSLPESLEDSLEISSGLPYLVHRKLALLALSLFRTRFMSLDSTPLDRANSLCAGIFLRLNQNLGCRYCHRY